MAKSQSFKRVLCAAIIAAVLNSASAGPLLPGFHECILNNRHYTIGEVFHPVLTINNIDYHAVCFECTCLPTTIAQCEEIKCDAPDCPNPIRLDGECCPICIAPDIQPGPQGCLYEGLHFGHGVNFHPPSMVQEFESSTTDITENPYCIECQCDDGEVNCENIAHLCAPLVDCNETEAILPDGSCCKVCPSPPPELRPGCMDFDGHFFEEGQFWHPTLPDYGVVECINCTCVGSQAQCEKLPCPEVPICGPDDPVEDIVVCCPKCLRVPGTPDPDKPTPDTTIPVPELNFTTPSDLAPDITPCENPYIYRIYKATSYDCMAIENTETLVVEVYKWYPDAESDGIVRDHRVLSKSDFQQFEFYDDFYFVGFTLARRVNGLTSRESKKRRIENCTSECSQLVVNMLRPVTESETQQC